MQLVTQSGQAFTLKMGKNIIGRAPGNDIVLADGSMSRRHAEIQWDGKQCQIVDLGSTNGTYLGTRRLSPNLPHAVSPGERLSFGPTMAATLLKEGAGIQAAGLPPVHAPSLSPAPRLNLLLRALDIALDRRKIGLALLGFLAASLLVAIFFWLMSQVAPDSAIAGIAIGLVGGILLWCMLVFVLATITRLILVELREGRQQPVREAIQYAAQHLLSFLLSPLLLLVGLLLILVGEVLLLMLGRIDYLGELIVSVAFLPLVILNLGLILIAWFGTTLIFPTIADRGGGIRDTIAFVLSAVRRAPGRLVAYVALAGVVSLLMFLFLSYLILAATYTTIALATASMEPVKFLTVFGGLPFDLQSLLPGSMFGSFGGYLLREPPVTVVIARFLFQLSLLLLVMVVLTIPQMFYLASICAVYLNIRADLIQPSSGPEDTGGNLPTTYAGVAAGQKQCQTCGAPLAYDQTYCPHCRQMQH